MKTACTSSTGCLAVCWNANLVVLDWHKGEIAARQSRLWIHQRAAANQTCMYATGVTTAAAKSLVNCTPSWLLLLAADPQDPAAASTSWKPAAWTRSSKGLSMLMVVLRNTIWGLEKQRGRGPDA
jgi:hypothetical protein